jgi:hypothetical protein
MYVLNYCLQLCAGTCLGGLMKTTFYMFDKERKGYNSTTKFRHVSINLGNFISQMPNWVVSWLIVVLNKSNTNL